MIGKTEKTEKNTAEEKKKVLDTIISELDKKFGKGTIMKLGESGKKVSVKSIPTGSISLDLATGIGGIPRGRITEIFGAEASGKTTLTLQVIANVQKQGGIAAFIDAEHALDVNYARKLGVNVEELLISQPGSGEQALEITETLARSGAIDLIVIDSVAALVPQAELEGNMDTQQVGLHARLMSKAMRMLTSTLARTNTAAVFINQTRMKIGMGYGNPETTTGGMALKFYASMRISLKKIMSIKEKGEHIGNRVKATIVKNKLAPPFREAEFEIYFGKGISKESELIDIALQMGLIQKNGSWFSLKTPTQEISLGQGKENARRFLEENPNLAEWLEKRILSSISESSML